MVYLTHKWKNNRKYLYLEKKARIDGKVKRVFQIYLGAEDKIEERQIMLNSDKLEIRTYNVGTAILWQVAERIGLLDIINESTDKKRKQGISVGDYILVGILNRCVDPCSKKSIPDWLKGDYLGFRYQDFINHLDSQGYWNHFQYFTADILAGIQSVVTKTVLEEFQITLDLILYDPTNFFTNQGIHKDDQIAKFGTSKEKRFDKRIVNLSLLTTKSDGIPLWHQTYEGGIHDATHFKSTISKITDFMEFLQYELNELTLVLDKGNHSEETMKFIEEKSLGIITSIRKSSHKEKLQVPNHEFQFIRLRNDSQVSFIKFSHNFHSIDGVLYIIYDRRVKKRSLAIFARNLKRKRKAIQEFLKNRLNQHKWTKQKNVEKKLKELCGAKHFKKIFQFIIEGEEAQLKVSIKEASFEKARYCRQMGKAAIFSNRTTWTPQVIIQTYRDMFIIEDCFRQIKDPRSIAIRPMYHFSDLSIHVHVFICIMAYLLNTLARKILSESGLDLTIKQFQNCISKLQITEIGRGQLKQPLLQLNAMDGDVKEMARIFQLSRVIDELRNTNSKA